MLKWGMETAWTHVWLVVIVEMNDLLQSKALAVPCTFFSSQMVTRTLMGFLPPSRRAQVRQSKDNIISSLCSLRTDAFIKKWLTNEGGIKDEKYLYLSDVWNFVLLVQDGTGRDQGIARLIEVFQQDAVNCSWKRWVFSYFLNIAKDSVQIRLGTSFQQWSRTFVKIILYLSVMVPGDAGQVPITGSWKACRLVRASGGRRMQSLWL